MVNLITLCSEVLTNYIRLISTNNKPKEDKMQLFGFKFRGRIRKPNAHQVRKGVRDNNPSFFYKGTTINAEGVVGKRYDIGRLYLHVANYDR